MTVGTLGGAGAVDLAGADVLIMAFGHARAGDADCKAIATQQAVINTPVRPRVVGFLGRETLFANRSEAVEAAVWTANASICRTGKSRLCHACAVQPAPEGADPRPHRIAELNNAARMGGRGRDR